MLQFSASVVSRGSHSCVIAMSQQNYPDDCVSSDADDELASLCNILLPRRDRTIMASSKTDVVRVNPRCPSNNASQGYKQARPLLNHFCGSLLAAFFVHAKKEQNADYEKQFERKHCGAQIVVSQIYNRTQAQGAHASR